MTAYTLACHTEGCPNQGIPIVLEPAEEGGFDAAYCGGCGEPITDITEGGKATP